MTSGTNDSGEITQVSGAETAVLAGGCFWGMQDLIRRRPGVLETRVGYTGGQNEHLTYRDHPGHAEAIEVVFDPSRTSYRDILALFFQIHDPSTLNRQGNDRATSYRSAISPGRAEAGADRPRHDRGCQRASGLWPGKATTSIEPVGPFWARRSPSTRTTWRSIRTATPATSPATARCCLSGVRPAWRRSKVLQLGPGIWGPRSTSPLPTSHDGESPGQPGPTVREALVLDVQLEALVDCSRGWSTWMVVGIWVPAKAPEQSETISLGA